jgi:acyl carrier protein
MDRRASIVSIIQAVSGKKIAPDPGESLFDSGILDSFALTDLIAGIEKAFSLRIPDSDLNPRKFDSVERIEEYLDGRAG